MLLPDLPWRNTDTLPGLHARRLLSAQEPACVPDDIPEQTIYHDTALHSRSLPIEKKAAFLSPSEYIS